MTTYRIPFNRAYLAGEEMTNIAQALANNHISGDGPFTKRCTAWLTKTLGIPRAFLTTSCTHALEMTAMLLDIQEGDEIILPSFTFVSTVNAFVLRGARPVFIDIHPDTLNLDESQVEAKITERTRAIIVVHYAGVGCEMVMIRRIADNHQIPVIEDNAHGILGKYRGQFLGTFGELATLSFHETKNFTCGEGGALLVNNPDLIERAEILREKGTNRSRFFRGQVDKYTWVDIGSSYLPSEILAAFLLAQFEASDEIQSRRKQIWDTYHSELAGWCEQQGVRQPTIPPECIQAYHMYYLIMPSLAARTALINYLKSEGILSVFHYIPLHLSEMGRRFGGKPGDCPITEDLSDRLIRLPFYTGLQQNELQDVIDHIHHFQGA